jgi:hypothetical protein
MPSRSLGDRLQDILISIDLARGFVADMSEHMLIAGAGSVYRRDYEDVESRRPWQTVMAGLEPLRQVVIDELASIERVP